MIEQRKQDEIVRREEAEITPAGTAPDVAAIVQDIKPPEGMSADEARQIEQHAVDIVKQLVETKDEMQAMKIEEGISNLGTRAESDAIKGMKGIFDSKIGEMLRREGKENIAGRSVTKDLVELRRQLREINPTELEKSFFGKIPFIGDRILKVIDRIASKYEHVSNVIQEIDKSLNAAKNRALQDNAELTVRLVTLKGLQKNVDWRIYQGKLIVKNIDAMMASTTDAQKQSEMKETLFHVLSRLNSLARANAMLAQGYAQIKVLRNNNNELARELGISADQGMVVVTNILIIYTAAQRQKEIIDAINQFHEFLGNGLISAAKMTKDNQSRVYGALRDSLTAMDNIREANAITEEALRERDQFIQQGITAARTEIPQLEKMATDMMNRVKGVRIEEMNEIELGALPTRPTGGAERPKI